MKRIALVVVVLVSLIAAAHGQQNGVLPYQLYDQSSFDTIDLTHGTVQLHLPLTSYPQKGTLPTLSSTLVYNSPSWTIALDEGSVEGGLYNTWFFNNPNTGSTGVVTSPAYFYGGYVLDSNSTSTVPRYIQLVGDATGAVHPLYTTNLIGGTTTIAGHTEEYYLGATNDASGLFAYGGSNGANYVDRNGIQYGCDTPGCSGMYMQDPSGNTVTGTAGYLLDSVGRQIPEFTTADLAYGNGGCVGKQFPVFGGGTAPITLCYENVVAHTQLANGSISDREGTGNFVAVSSVTLPNGTSWHLTYDSWGSLSTVTTPTGAVMTYNYITAFAYPNQVWQRIVQSKTLAVNGTTYQWSYNYGSTTLDGTLIPESPTTVTDPTGNITVNTIDYNGYPTKIQYENAQGAVLRTVQTSYNVVSGPLTPAAAQGEVPASTTTTLDNGQVSKTLTIYDSIAGGTCASPQSGDFSNPAIILTDSNYSNITAPMMLADPVYQCVYDYGQGAPGALLSETHNTFQWQANSAYLKANLRDLAASTTVDLNGTTYASSTFGYDENNGSPQGVYGNQTSATQVNSSGGSPRTQTIFNAQGMAKEICAPIDPSCSNSTIITYDGTGAYPSSIQRPTVNLLLKDGYQYDSNTGLMASHTDPNNYTTSYHYDSMRRLLSVSYPDAGTEQFAYTDTPGLPTIQAIQTENGSTSVITNSVLDALGRTTRTELASDSQGGSYVATTYDGLNRVNSVSTPYRTVTDPTYGVTTFSYDALGRPLYRREPNGTQSWSYLGNAVTFTDENGSEWTDYFDGLGRLTEVREPTLTSKSPGIETDYAYDPLKNLLGVTQRGAAGETARTRSFQYDSLSRLILATNPESGVTCYGTWSGGAVGSGACQNGYDLNGNLLSKTNANNATVTYHYDALNRLTSKSAPDGFTQYTYTYDQAAQGAGYLYGVSSPGQTGSEFTSYDPMGRVTSTSWFDYKKQTWRTGLALLYDRLGHVTQTTYPDGRIVQQNWDGAGRLAQVVDKTPSGSGTVYFGGASGGTAQYDPGGALTSATLGNGVAETFSENNRLQPLTYSANSSFMPQAAGGYNLLNRQIAYTSSGALPCNSTAVTSDNGNIYSIVDLLQNANSQSFGYDYLNRLTCAQQWGKLYNETYHSDSFGNLLATDNLHATPAYSIKAPTNWMLLNGGSGIYGDPAGGNLQYDHAGQLRLYPDPISGSHTMNYSSEGYLQNIDSSSTGSYLYDGMGDRILAVTNNTSWKEFVYLNGQPLAETSSTGLWTDHIYADGQRIAAVDSADAPIHLSGMNCSNCGQSATYIQLSGAAGRVIKSGDSLYLSQYAVNNAEGGAIVLFTDGSRADGYTYDQYGQQINCDAVKNQWIQRRIDLSAFAGKTVASTLLLNDICNTAAGEFDIYFNDVAIAGNGTTSTIYSPNYGQVFSPLDASTHPGQATNVRAVAEANTTAPGSATHYYVGDQVHTTQMELAAGGWPTWQGYFTPFGQEIVNGAMSSVLGEQVGDGTANRYKFTGKERDAESGLDYFGARYYASSMGRFSSPDPSGLEYADPTNPQSLNLYSYALNNPLKYTDPTGMYCDYSDHNDPSSGFDSSQFDYNSNSGECGQNGGSWVNDAYTHNGMDDLNRPQEAVSSNTNSGNDPWTLTDFQAMYQAWNTGVLPQQLNYGPNSWESIDMSHNFAVNRARAAYIKAGCPGSGTPWNSMAAGHVEAAVDSWGNVALGQPDYLELQVGGYSGTITTSGDTTTFTLYNPMSNSSFNGQSAASGGHSSDNPNGPNGPRHNTMQTFKWTEYSLCHQ